TWTELDVAVNRLASALVERGVREGDVVGVQAPNSVALIEAFLAIARLGGVVCPFPVQYREHELEPLARRAGVAGHLTTSELADRARNLDAWLLRLDGPRSEATPASPRISDPNECFTICWT